MSRAVLYCSPDHCVVLLDLPTSIAEAQNSDCQLVSTIPLTQPYLSTEPIGKKRDKLLASIPTAQLDHDGVIQSSLQHGLCIIRQNLRNSSWCFQRTCAEGDLSQDATGVFTSRVDGPEERYGSPPLILTPMVNRVRRLDHFQNQVVVNPAQAASVLHIGDLGSFNIPPKSTFVNATIQQGRPGFETTLQCLGLERGNAPAFHLILLDPPWTNRSVRHNRTYRSVEFQRKDPFRETLPIITDHLKLDGLVAIWITNKPAIRAQVAKEMGKLQLNLTEEWTWLKVTVHGEPVTQLDGLWRKPYESLLLFARTPSTSEVKLRTIVAVPDVHSRKPNLKFLFETFMPSDYQTLELFARSLTAGWWSWGDEVLKFQHHSHWIQLDQKRLIDEESCRTFTQAGVV